MKLIIEDDEGRKTVVPLVRDEITIGRQEGNTIRLTERNVSRRHAKLYRQNGSVFIEDLGSYTGVRVNGDKISQRTAIKENDLVEIGDYDLQIEGAAEAGEPDTNPTVKEVSPERAQAERLQAERAQSERAAAAAPAPTPAAVPRAPAPPPARKVDHQATAVVRLSDLNLPEAEARDLGAAESPKLVCLAGPLRGTEFVLRRSVVKFGRTPEGNDLVVDHQSISRQHGRFQLEGGGWKVYDNKSANGIRVNGEDYGMSPVRPGDTLELGHVKLRFCAPGEQFVPPRESAAAPQAAAAAPEAAPRSKTPLVIGIAAAVVVLAAVGAVVALSGGKKDKQPAGDEPPTVAQLCEKGRNAFINEKWSDAAKTLGIARTMGATAAQCADLDAMLEKSRAEGEAKAALEEAEQLMLDSRFKPALQRLKDVPADSIYAAEARTKTGQARSGALRQLADQAQKDIDRGKLEDAKVGIDEIEALDAADPAVGTLRTRLAEARKKAEVKTTTAPAAPRKSQAEIDEEAKAKITEANKLIQSGDFLGAIEQLKQAIVLGPGDALKAAGYRSLGIAHARAGKMDDAAKAYETYLKLAPGAADAAKVRQMLDGYYKQKGK